MLFTGSGCLLCLYLYIKIIEYFLRYCPESSDFFADGLTAQLPNLRGTSSLKAFFLIRIKLFLRPGKKNI
jgi:hypothetical protein